MAISYKHSPIIKFLHTKCSFSHIKVGGLASIQFLFHGPGCTEGKWPIWLSNSNNGPVHIWLLDHKYISKYRWEYIQVALKMYWDPITQTTFKGGLGHIPHSHIVLLVCTQMCPGHTEGPPTQLMYWWKKKPKHTHSCTNNIILVQVQATTTCKMVSTEMFFGSLHNRLPVKKKQSIWSLQTDMTYMFICK